MMMPLTQSVHLKSMVVQCAQGERFLLGQPTSTTLTLPRTPLCWSVLHSSSARNLGSAIAAASSSSRRKKKKSLSRNHVKEGTEEEEDAFELLFKQLEEDLKNDDLSIDDSDDEITEEDLARFEQELGDALGDIHTETLDSVVNDTETDNLEEDDVDDGDERPVELRNWQLRRLAKALKDGRRKTSIKSLAAELCLDRSVVLELLRDPPPNLLMMSLALPDKPAATLSVSETKPTEAVPEETRVDPEGPETEAKLPVHVMHNRWSDQKRLKKAQVDTLERIYRRTKRPTNAMISSIVHVTNLPRRRVVKWFEDKRTEDGVPDKRLPYQRSDSPVP